MFMINILMLDVQHMRRKMETRISGLIIGVFIKQILCCFFLFYIYTIFFLQYLKNLKIFLWKKRRFRLRCDSIPGLSIAGRVLLKKSHFFFTQLSNRMKIATCRPICPIKSSIEPLCATMSMFYQTLL